MKRLCVFLLPLLIILGSCNRDPKVVSKRYVESGNKYFEKQKYKEASLMYRQALAKDRLNGDAYYRLGRVNLQLGDFAGSYRALLRAYELQKENVEAMTMLADISLMGYLMDPKRPKQLLAEVRDISAQLLKLDPKSYQGLRLKGYLELSDGNTEESIKSFEAASAAKPFQKDVVVVLVQTLGQANRFAEAEKLWRQAIAESFNKSYRQLYDVMYIEYVKRNRLPDGEAVYKTGRENNPKDPYFVVRLANHYFALGKSDQMKAVLDEMIAKPADFPVAPRDVGDFYFRIGQLDQALKYYDIGVKASEKGNPKEKAGYQKREIEIFVQQGKRAEASQVLELLLKADPKDSEALSIRAALVLETGTREQVDKATTDLQSALVAMPKNPVVRFNLGRAYYAKRDFEQAKIQFQEAIKERPDYLPARLALAQLTLVRGDFASALPAADEVLQRSPGSVVGRLIRTSALSGLGNNAQARKELTELFKVAPNLRDAQFQLGLISFQEKKYKEAEEIFSRLRADAPTDPRSIVLLSETYLAEGRGADALKLLQGELVRDPNRADLRLAIAGVAMRAGNRDLAIKELSALVQKNPQDAGLQTRLGEAYRQIGDFKASIESFRKARDIAPNDVNANLAYSLMLEASGERAQAKVVYEHILKLQPDEPVVLNNLAYQLAEYGGDLDQALTYAQRAKQKAPANADIADTLGWIYIKKNLSDQAVGIFKELVQKNPGHVTWRYHLAMALYQKGDKLQARKELETCLKNRPSREEEARIKDLLGKIG